MKEKIYTIPLMDAFKSGDECPFCFIQRELEQHAISFILGSAYMEDDIRAETDKIGFCRHHYKMMFEYGNHLGNALMLSTHFKKLNEELLKEIKEFTPGKSSMLKRMKKAKTEGDIKKTSIGCWIQEKESNCYVCNHYNDNYVRYLDTFFELIKNNREFFDLASHSKGFCLPHFSDLIEASEGKLNEKQKKEFYPMIFDVMEKNMKRIEEEVSWFVEKYDYRNKDKDWKNSKDSIPRGMQKAAGGHPSDPVFISSR